MLYYRLLSFSRLSCSSSTCSVGGVAGNPGYASRAKYGARVLRTASCLASLAGPIAVRCVKVHTGFDSLPTRGYAAPVWPRAGQVYGTHHLAEISPIYGGSPWDRTLSIICYTSPRTVASCGSNSI